jgi:hypothetical protein
MDTGILLKDANQLGGGFKYGKIKGYGNQDDSNKPESLSQLSCR